MPSLRRRGWRAILPWRGGNRSGNGTGAALEDGPAPLNATAGVRVVMPDQHAEKGLRPSGDPPADPLPAGDHAALRVGYDELQARLLHEARAHDRERAAHARTASRLARLTGAPPPAEPAKAPARSRIHHWFRARVSPHLALIEQLYRASSRYPRLHRLLWTAAKLAWWTVTLQLRRRILDEWKHGARSASGLAAIGSPRFRLRPVVAAAASPVRPRGDRRMICLTHVLPHPPRAGNEYRIARMLAWLSRQGWEVLLIVVPQVEGAFLEHDIRQAATVIPNLIVCRHDGTLLHHLSCDGAMLEKLDDRRPRDFAAALGERASGNRQSRRTTDILRMFCPDGPVELLLHLETHFDPQIVLAEYVFMTRAFPLLRPGLRKVIDTIDVFSNKAEKVERYGVDDASTMAAGEEARLLKRADLLIAIQSEEKADLQALAPTVPIVNVGVDFDVPEATPLSATAPVVLLIASDNRINVKGLRDFLSFAWPLVRREVPDAELRVIGTVGESAEAWSPDIRILGCIDDIAAAYAQARVVINPAVAGTGLKIKTVEAVSHRRPIVLWPSGVEGVAPPARAMCQVATDWFDFARRVVGLLRREDDAGAVTLERQELISHFAPDRVYAPLVPALDSLIGAGVGE
jgi:hypothetical protein